MTAAPVGLEQLYEWIDRRQILPRHLWMVRPANAHRSNPSWPAGSRPSCAAPIPCTRSCWSVRPHRPADRSALQLVTTPSSINSLWTARPAPAGSCPTRRPPGHARHGRAAGQLHVLVFRYLLFSRAARDSPRPISPPALLRASSTSSTPASAMPGRPPAASAETGWERTFAVGRDERLRRRLNRPGRRRSQPRHVLGWTNGSRLLMTHHVVSASRGATTQEPSPPAPDARNQIVPGQEEGNYELLRRHHVGRAASRRLTPSSPSCGGLRRSGCRMEASGALRSLPSPPRCQPRHCRVFAGTGGRTGCHHCRMKIRLIFIPAPAKTAAILARARHPGVHRTAPARRRLVFTRHPGTPPTGPRRAGETVANGGRRRRRWHDERGRPGARGRGRRARPPCLGSGNGLALHLGVPPSHAAPWRSWRTPPPASPVIDTGTANGPPFFNAMGLAL